MKGKKMTTNIWIKKLRGIIQSLADDKGCDSPIPWQKPEECVCDGCALRCALATLDQLVIQLSGGNNEIHAR